MLQIRRYFALVSLNDRLYAVGGRVNFKEDLNFVESYDPLKNKWELATPMNRKRCAHSAIVHKNRLFVLGGLAEDSIDDSVEFYDPTIDKWTMVLLLLPTIITFLNIIDIFILADSYI